MHPRDLDLTFNPFVDSSPDSASTPQNRQYYGSVFLPNVQTPISRRRLSFGSAETSTSTIRKRHTRTRTDFNVDVDTPDSPISGHPLKSAALKSAAFDDSDITRPNLSRRVRGPGTLVRSASYGGEDSESLAPIVQEEEKEVIVHEITSKDSLAGVSLKYGISLPELRRANQLWANDSIHLRKVLYVPMDRAKRAHEYVAARRMSNSPISDTSDCYPADGTPYSPPTRATLNGFPAMSRPVIPEQTKHPEIRKIPASQLSFFPPSTNPSRTQTPSGSPSPASTDFTAKRPAYLQPSDAGTRSAPPLAANSLTSLLNALPINASTRDEIVSRLSFDSVSSSYSDRPRSRLPSDGERGHELNDVNQRGLSPQKGVVFEREYIDVSTPRPTAFSDIPLASNIKTASPAPQALHTTRPLLSTSPPSSYIAQHPHNPYVRTQQLEPSPGMQLPMASKGPVSRLGRSQSLGKTTFKSGIRRTTVQSSISETPSKPTSKASDRHDVGIDLKHL